MFSTLNPFLGIRSYLGLTQPEMGRLVDLTAQTVANYEAGIIGEPDELVVKHYIEVFDAPVARGSLMIWVFGHDAEWQIKNSPAGVVRAYHDFQYQKRVKSGALLLNPNASMDFKVQKNGHPFVQWRERAIGTRKKFCMLFCIPYASLSLFEQTGYVVPQWLRSILFTAGVGRDELATLDSHIKEWYSARSGR